MFFELSRYSHFQISNILTSPPFNNLYPDPSNANELNMLNIFSKFNSFFLENLKLSEKLWAFLQLNFFIEKIKVHRSNGRTLLIVKFYTSKDKLGCLSNQKCVHIYVLFYLIHPSNEQNNCFDLKKPSAIPITLHIPWKKYYSISKLIF